MLCGKIVLNFFFEVLIWMWLSFEIVEKCMSVDVINFLMLFFLLSKGESLFDMMCNFEVMVFDIIVMCYLYLCVLYVLVECIELSIINVGDGVYEYLMQVFFDVLMICQEKGCFDGLCVVIVGDIEYLCVVCLNIYLFWKMGFEVVVVGLCMMMLVYFDCFGVDVRYWFDEVIEGVDVVMMLCVQMECQSCMFFLLV